MPFSHRCRDAFFDFIYASRTLLLFLLLGVWAMKHGCNPMKSTTPGTENIPRMNSFTSLVGVIPLSPKRIMKSSVKSLTGQCISHKPHLKGGGEIRNTINWDAGFYKGELIDPTVTCYADIPRDCLGLHTKE